MLNQFNNKEEGVADFELQHPSSLLHMTEK